MKTDILTADYRNGVLENIHPGYICGVDTSGGIRYSAGNPKHITFLRSAFKPVQAIPAIIHNIQGHFGLTNRETALITASHRGEPFHIEALETLREKIGVPEKALLCHPAYPLNPEAKDALVAAHKPKRRLYHNCSGKHLGMIALAKVLGVSIDDYYKPEHPVQQEILKATRLLADCEADEIEKGVDGCGVPVYALPLNTLAAIYLRFACPELIADESLRAAARTIAALMNDQPDIISGTEAICSSLLMDDNIVAKGGAQGVYGFGLKKEQIGFSLKVLDGTEEQWPLVVAAILEQIHYENTDTIERLYALSQKDIFNDNDQLVGHKEATFTLSMI